MLTSATAQCCVLVFGPCGAENKSLYKKKKKLDASGGSFSHGQWSSSRWSLLDQILQVNSLNEFGIIKPVLNSDCQRAVIHILEVCM